jgi:guanylate kinase
MAHVLTLTGPSGSGKSTAVSMLEHCSPKRFRAQLIPKYTTRPPREQLERDAICVDALPSTCDLIYEQYGVRYGLDTDCLYDKLSAGISPIVILNDVRAVEDVRQAFGRLTCSLFVFRESPSEERQLRLARQRGLADEAEVRLRFRKAQAIFRIYIENIHMFDHVLLNVGDVEHLGRQVKAVVKKLISESPLALRLGSQS